MRHYVFLGLGLLILVGCGQTKAPLRLVSTSVSQAVIVQNTRDQPQFQQQRLWLAQLVLYQTCVASQT